MILIMIFIIMIMIIMIKGLGQRVAQPAVADVADPRSPPERRSGAVSNTCKYIHTSCM